MGGEGGRLTSFILRVSQKTAKKRNVQQNMFLIFEGLKNVLIPPIDTPFNFRGHIRGRRPIWGCLQF